MNSTTASPDVSYLLGAYRRMLVIRRFEEACLDLRRRDLVAGSIHLCCGQEAVPVGAVEALGPEDRVISTYRGHGWAIALDVPLEGLLAEVCGRATGVNGGRGGSAYLSAPAQRFIGENSIVGAGVPIAAGVGLAMQLRGKGVVLVSIGDGATNQGAVHEGIVISVARRLPVIVVCENNGWSEMTPIEATVHGSLADRAAAYGLPSEQVDGTDVRLVADAVSRAADRARGGLGPSFLECRVPRLLGHYNADVEHYRPQSDREAAAAADPLVVLHARLRDDGRTNDLEEAERDATALVDAARKIALAAPFPDPGTARAHVTLTPVAPPRASGPRAAASAPSEMTFVQAVNRALERELEERPEAVVFGEDVAVPGGVFGATRSLLRRFGPERVFDTPIAESAILGSALGCSLEGLRPVVEVMWSDFLLVALDQLVNQAANVRYLSEGRRSAPMVVRCQQGVAPGSCAQHCQSLEALLAHVPGLRVGLPSTPGDAYAMLRAAVADPDPCVVIESRLLYGTTGQVDLDAPVEPVGGARRLRDGTDAALITWGRLTATCAAAADRLAEEGIDAAVLDLRWLAPLDDDAIRRVVEPCGRVVVVHEATITGGFGAEIAARVADDLFWALDAPVRRVASPDVRFPASPILQQALVPDMDRVVEAVRRTVRG